MPAATFDLSIEQGTTFVREFVWKTDVNGVQTPVNLTSYTARMQIRRTSASSTILFEATTANGKLTIPNYTDGKIVLTVTANESTAWKWREAVYDLEVQVGDTVTRLLNGAVEVIPEVTR